MRSVSFDGALLGSAGGGVGGREDAMSESESVWVLWLEDELLLTPRPAFPLSIVTSPCLSFFCVEDDNASAQVAWSGELRRIERRRRRR